MKRESINLVNNGRSNYRIVISHNASDTIKYSASELNTFLKQISGADIPIISDDKTLTNHEILLGNGRHLQQNKPVINENGFAIFTDDKNLSIIGKQDQATLYGVYTFLEKYLGCRWYSSEVSYIPKCNSITIDPINDIQMPKLKSREVYYADAMDPNFSRRQKLNTNASIIQNGKIAVEKHRGWGTWCHTFYAFVSPEKYFKEHPEYFSLINGRREPESQLCLTNPDVLRITIDELRKRIHENPEEIYWDVSQNDRISNCECPNCKAIDEREGTYMGSVLEFVNKVADEFPDKTISTLSYQYTRKPPRNIKPADNVSIMLCSIECNRSQPISTDPPNASFRSDIENWAKICDNLFIWDYVVQFSSLVSPFPNLRVLQPNIQFFADNNVRGVFAQGNREARGEFAHLRAYLLSKLLWDPNCNFDYSLNDFLKGYYGKAGELIGKYIELMHDELGKSGKALNIFGSPDDHKDGYLSDKMIAEYDKVFDEAEQTVRSDTDLLIRVQEARMPLMYAKLELGVGDVEIRREIAKDLFEIAETVGLNAFNEWNLPIDKYRDQMIQKLRK